MTTLYPVKRSLRPQSLNSGLGSHLRGPGQGGSLRSRASAPPGKPRPPGTKSAAANSLTDLTLSGTRWRDGPGAPRTLAAARASRTGREASLGGSCWTSSPYSSGDPRHLPPGKAALCPICVASHPALGEACQDPGGPLRATRSSPSLHPPRPRRGGPRTLSAARPPPGPAGSRPTGRPREYSQRRAARGFAAEGDERPGAPARRSCRPRGGGRAGRARSRAPTPRRSVTAALSHFARARAAAAATWPARNQLPSGLLWARPAPDSKLGKPAQWPLVGRGCGAVMAPAPWVKQKQEAPHGSAEVLYKQDFACLAPCGWEAEEGTQSRLFLEPAPRIQIEKVPLRLS